MKENVSANVYQTGSTTPPKSHQGIIALLLSLVIFLSGIVTALSVMNVKLFQLLQDVPPAAESVSFSRTGEAVAEAYDLKRQGQDCALGIQGQNVDGAVGNYLQYPQGVYVCAVVSGSPAEKAGVAVGDILVSLEDITVSDVDSLNEAAMQLTAGKQIRLRVFRDGSYQELTTVME